MWRRIHYMPTHKTLKATLSGAFALPALVLALSGCTAAAPSSVQPSEDTSQGQPADSAAPEGDSGAAMEEVIAVDLEFMPEDITVPVGTTVRWTNGETVNHTVTSGAWGEVNEGTGMRGTQTPDGMFDHDLAPMGQEGDTFEFTFEEPGEYPYYCEPHLGMFGTITVE